VDRCCGLPGAWVVVSEESAVVWVLDEAQVVVWGMVAAGFVTVVGCDVAAGRRSSGHERRGCGGCRGAVGRLGKVCRRFRGAGGSSDCGGGAIVVVVNGVDRLSAVTWQAVEMAGGMEIGQWAVGRAVVGQVGGWQGVGQGCVRRCLRC
jgi:hypothetical protein